MAVYEYECDDGHITEREHPLGQAFEDVSCGDPGCNLLARKILSASGHFLWKAGGGQRLDPKLVKEYNGGPDE